MRLKPTDIFDEAIIDPENMIYSYKLLIQVLLKDKNYFDAILYFDNRIEPLTNQGLKIFYDGN
jgi:hypothetical protein